MELENIHKYFLKTNSLKLLAFFQKNFEVQTLKRVMNTPSKKISLKSFGCFECFPRRILQR